VKKPEIIQKFSIFAELKDWSENTKNDYISIVKKFVYNKHPDSINNLTKEYLKQYMINFKHENSKAYYNKMGWVLISLYECIGQKYKMNWFTPLRINKKLIDVLTQEEVFSIIDRIKFKKHKIIILLLFSTGIRINELCNLKISDINSNKMKIFIRNGKGQKDRIIPLHSILLKELREYWKEFKPINYILQGQHNEKYSATSIRNVIKKYSNHLNKNVYPHLFRHSAITYLIDKNEQQNKVQLFAGHKNPKSTAWYYNLSENSLKNMQNPLDL
jgi:integrase